jgi:hypothetical protein
MTNVRLERKTNIPFGLAFETLGTILSGIADQTPLWKGFALHVDLGDAGLPSVGYVAIPIALEIGPIVPGIDQYTVTIRAARNSQTFPVFEGAMGADMVGRSASMLWLAGSYAVPLGSLGSVLNASLARGVAQRALHNFLSDVADACIANTVKRETENVRRRSLR